LCDDARTVNMARGCFHFLKVNKPNALVLYLMELFDSDERMEWEQPGLGRAVLGFSLIPAMAGAMCKVNFEISMHRASLCIGQIVCNYIWRS
jgi:hypothetical protein